MSMVLPEKLKGFSLFVDGQGYGGRAEEVTLPKLARKMEEYRGGGMDRPVKIDMGGEALTAEFVLAEYTPDVLKQWGLTTVDGLGLRLKGSVKADNVDGDEIPVEVVLRGRFSEIDQGKWKGGDSATMKVACELAYYEYKYNGESLIKIDVIGSEEVVGGTDRLASRRKNLGL